MSEAVVVSGSAGFIGGYVVQELLDRAYTVIGVDNYSKYGKVVRSYDDDPKYRFVEGDARDVELMTKLLTDADHFIAGAAIMGVLLNGLRSWSFTEGMMDALDMLSSMINSGSDPAALGRMFNWFGLFAFLALCLFMYLDSRRARPAPVAEE